jgi:hypothetical protein
MPLRAVSDHVTDHSEKLKTLTVPLIDTADAWHFSRIRSTSHLDTYQNTISHLIIGYGYGHTPLDSRTPLSGYKHTPH